MQITIDRPKKEDIKEIQKLFHTVLVDTFNKNTIPEAYTVPTLAGHSFVFSSINPGTYNFAFGGVIQNAKTSASGLFIVMVSLLSFIMKLYQM